MIHKETIKAQKRVKAGKGAARATRKEGLLPGVIYGDKKEATLIALDPREITKHWHKKHFKTTQFEVVADGEKHLTMCQDVQMHPVTDRPIHVDFLRINPKSELHLEIPITLMNEEACLGLKHGGVLNLVRREIEVVCLANNIPEDIKIDLSKLNMGDNVHIHDIVFPEGVKPVDAEQNFTILTIATPTVMVEEAGSAESAATAEGEKKAEGDAKQKDSKQKDSDKKGDDKK